MHIRFNRYTIFDALAALAMLAWFVLPVSTGNVPIGSTAGFKAEVLKPFMLPIHSLGQEAGGGNLVSGFLLFSLYLVPLFALFRLVFFFVFTDRFEWTRADSLQVCGLRFATTCLMLAGYLIPMMRYADSSAWFRALPLPVLLSVPCAAALNVASLVMLIRLSNLKNPVYTEYMNFKKTGKRTASIKRTSPMAVAEFFFRIRTKLFIAFVGIIIVILTVFTTVLLQNYRSSILKAVGDGAKSQVEQASATYRINLGDKITLLQYFTRQIELNSRAEFRYQDLTIYTNLKDELYLDALPARLANMEAEYSTLDARVRYPELPALPADALQSNIAAGVSAGNVLAQTNKGAGTIGYYSPIVKIDTIRAGNATTRRERLLGFSVMTFREDIIMRPFYRTRVTVIVFALVFMYIAIVLTYLVGNYIVNPLLFLRMNVRKISDVLGTMIRGESRVSSNALVYNDVVHSRDEIKTLSGEIDNMVTVIRGIVPYISASTLKHADKGAAHTSRKDLAFLFTDIRGFTTMCEGMEPEAVVAVLNRYLDLETEIIMNNHGDVDKFVGDEMMAFFDGPEKELNACRAAMQIRAAMVEERKEREKNGLPVVAIGIGINSGSVVFGSVGARDRMDFTSIGDTVNLAARLEGATKAYGSESIISEAVYQKVKTVFLCRELDFIAVKGKTEPVRIFEILHETPEATPVLTAIKANFEKGLAYYRSRQWEKAATFFKKLAETYRDQPSGAYLKRVQHFMKNEPPADWDGVFRMTVK